MEWYEKWYDVGGGKIGEGVLYFGVRRKKEKVGRLGTKMDVKSIAFLALGMCVCVGVG